ncbi:hypothetical protein MWH25_03095 [Natroniella acetigena]|uniref:hypothetical protein n=1 Tax=Natroniella acetigena TaxID=52004 RepID=UPI002009E376|nr:hypothetical protein [Natroniella acetigena]MCK8826730.1 hypothetical protein [Natroniella acetigena]
MSDFKISTEDEIKLLNERLESISLEESSLAYFFNSQTEKIQRISEKELSSPQDMINFQHEVLAIMKDSVKLQILLQCKVEEILTGSSFKGKKKDVIMII